MYYHPPANAADNHHQPDGLHGGGGGGSKAGGDVSTTQMGNCASKAVVVGGGVDIAELVLYSGNPKAAIPVLLHDSKGSSIDGFANFCYAASAFQAEALAIRHACVLLGQKTYQAYRKLIPDGR
ncbi:hypothetical protein C3L33_08300, partial [Rhododendron williamsianum]